MSLTKRTFVHVEVGNADWTPTMGELRAIHRKFKQAIEKASPGETPVIVTRHGVRVSVVEFDPLMYATTGYMQVYPSTYTNQPPQQVPPYQPYIVTATASNVQGPNQ
jgi:hypothetical protein